MEDKKVIIYKQDNGRVAVIHPTPEAFEIYDIYSIAEKVVPVGKPYKIIDKSEIPTDRAFRDAWDINESELTDGIGNFTNGLE
jgi:hypothetical protein